MNQTNLPAVVKTAITEQKIDLSQVNLMLPTQTFGEVLGQYDRVTIEVVTVDPNPWAGEVAEIGGKKALGRVPLEKIGAAVGIIWDPANTTVLESTSTKSRAKATGALRKPNGEWIVLSEEKSVDLEALEEEQRLGLEEKAAKGNPEKVTKWGKTESGKSYPLEYAPWKSEEEKNKYIELALRKALLQYRKFKDERAMTGAKERCIRALLAIKHSYTDKELAKPFAFPRVLPDVNKMLANPEVRQAAIDRMTGAASSIFGPGNGRERNVTPERQAIEKDAGLEISESEVHEAPSEPLPTFNAPEPAEQESEEQVIRSRLQQYVDDPKYAILGEAKSPAGKSARDLVKDLLAREDTSLDELAEMDARVQDYFIKYGGQSAGGVS
jgi:hypothetical protein